MTFPDHDRKKFPMFETKVQENFKHISNQTFQGPQLKTSVWEFPATFYIFPLCFESCKSFVLFCF